MNKNKIIILLVSLLAILALIFVGNSNSTITGSANDFAINDTASVTKFFLADKNNNQVLLERTDLGWTVDKNSFARQSLIDIVLKTMQNLSVRYPVSNAAHENIIRVLSVKSVKVEIYQEVYRINLFNKIKLFPYEKKSKVYYVGDPTQNNIGTHMWMEGAKEAYVIYMPGFRGYIASRFSSISLDWRDQTIIRKSLAEIQSVKLEFNTEPHQSFQINNVNNRTVELYQLEGNVKVDNFDTLKVVEFLTNFRKLSFEAILNGTNPQMEDSIRYVTPFQVLTIEDVQGNKSQIKTYLRPKHDEYETEKDYTDFDIDRLYALINDDKDFVLIQYFTFDPIFRPIEYYLKK